MPCFLPTLRGRQVFLIAPTPHLHRQDHSTAPQPSVLPVGGLTLIQLAP